MTPSDVPALLDEFRASRREFLARLRSIPPERRDVPPAPGAWSARDLVAHAAAWLEEADDRIPRLLAGAPSVSYDRDAFNAAAIARAAGWTCEQALTLFRRAADRFEAIVSDSDAEELADIEDVMAWLRNVAHTLMNEHFDQLDRLATPASDGGDAADSRR